MFAWKNKAICVHKKHKLIILVCSRYNVFFLTHILMQYIEPVFRPPSEWKSLILQVTNGCSWNQCSFCEMYTADQKKFSLKSKKDLQQDIEAAAREAYVYERVFLADGDAMTLSYRRLETILSLIKTHLPSVRRVSSYCLPRNLNNKSVDELINLKESGLKMVYVGCESGDDEVLAKVNKGETYASSLQALSKLKQAGIKSSIMILNGLGGHKYSKQHAINSARLMNEAQPEYLSTLVVSFPMGEQRYRANFTDFQMLDTRQLIEEMYVLVNELELEKTIFRSDHASNYLVLKGVLGRDKKMMLERIVSALQQPGSVPLRQEWQRGL